MRYKGFFGRKGFATVTDSYEKMIIQSRSNMGEMHALIGRWKRHALRTRQDKDKGLKGACMNQLETLVTYHSLKLTDTFSLSLEDTAALLIEGKTLYGRNFDDQLKAINHRRILNYSIQYQRELEQAGWGGRWGLDKRKSPPNENILGGIEDLANTCVLTFGEGSAGNFDVMYGDYHPTGTLYFMDRNEQEYVLTGQKLLIQTLKEPVEDPFLNAAIIHNEFARGHQFDNTYGLLFCRLYMNFALMLTGHAPAVIDSSKKEEYLQLSQPINLANPLPLASFLVKSMNDTYKKYILPILEDEVPSYIDLDCKQDYLSMESEYKLAQDYFKEGNFHEARTHIDAAKKYSSRLEGITPLIMGTHIGKLSKFEKEIEEKLCQLKF